MSFLLGNRAYFPFAAASLAVSLNLLLLWVYSGVVRGRSKTAINPEDGKRFDAPVVETDPPAVARVLRAHANAQAMAVPFFALGMLFVLADGPGNGGMVLFGSFVVTRYLHSAFYLLGWQPWRTLAFALNGLSLLALAVNLISMLSR